MSGVSDSCNVVWFVRCLCGLCNVCLVSLYVYLFISQAIAGSLPDLSPEEYFQIPTEEKSAFYREAKSHQEACVRCLLMLVSEWWVGGWVNVYVSE